MKALCWFGANDLKVKDVPDPQILGARDAIVKVRLSSVCGSDLHLVDGYVPTMKKGDIIGHEFMGEVVDTGPEVRKLKRGDRVVVSSIIACGECSYCRNEHWSQCDNSNPNGSLTEKAYGHSTAGIFGYSHAFGGFPGSHAEYVRVPFADRGCFRIPEGVRDESAVFLSDAAPTGYMAADFCRIQPGDTIAVWGAGAVGHMAMWAAQKLGASRIIAIDRFPYRLESARKQMGVEILNYGELDIADALNEITAGRGPDACIDAVGMEAHGSGLDYAFDRAKQAARLQTDRPTALREAIYACRKGGVVSVVGVYGGFVDKFPMGAVVNKGLTIRSAQQHAQKYIPRLLEYAQRGELDPSYLLTHTMPLDDGPKGYALFKKKSEGCLRVAFRP
jgi:threonine dehydrogenase-like Zn-dependent dehydrogenase